LAKRDVYPGTGYPQRIGEGAGKGYNLNVPLPSPGDIFGRVTDDDLLAAFDNHLLPQLETTGFVPDMIFISAGFDSRQNDYLGNFSITDEGFSALTRRVMTLARKACEGRIVSVLEGGYNPEGLALATCAHLQALMEARPLF
jgi:acetoin utilization deacetylase AcuC-like enzyme